MGSILMCKNAPVYNIDTNEVISNSLLPGYMQVMSNNPNKFKTWLKLRYSSNTNSIARQLKGITFGQGNRVRINRETRAFSLSDCYWIKRSDENIAFEEASPYYSDFWTGAGVYRGQAIPTLYVPGYLNKYWLNSKILCKLGQETLIEHECSRVCKILGVPVENIQILPDKSGIAVENITSPNLMLEQADQSGRIDPDDFDNSDIIKLFGLSGYQMILVDAIIGNGDRHAGNFGWLRDTNTGKYVGMAPLYDFDHALDSKSTGDIMIQDAISLAKSNNIYKNFAIQAINKLLHIGTEQLFMIKAKAILSNIQ